MMDSLDELNSESLKFNKHQQLVLKQIQGFKHKISLWNRGGGGGAENLELLGPQSHRFRDVCC